MHMSPLWKMNNIWEIINYPVGPDQILVIMQLLRKSSYARNNVDIIILILLAQKSKPCDHRYS